MMQVIAKTTMWVAVSMVALMLSCVVIMPLFDGHSTLTVVNRGKLAVSDVTLIGAWRPRAHRVGSVSPGDSVRFVIKGLGEDYYTGVLRRSDGSTDTVTFERQVSDGMGIDDTLLVSDTSAVLHLWKPSAEDTSSTHP